MKDITKILFPTDFSPTAQNAFRHCLLLANRYNADIELLHVIYPEYEVMDLPVVSMETTRKKVETAKIVMQSFVEMGITQVQTQYQLDNLPTVIPSVELGSPVEVINFIANRDEADLIVLGTKGEHNLLEKTFGSVTTGVINKAHCPVWVIPEYAPCQIPKVIAYATDANHSDPFHIWKAGKLMEPFNAAFHCVHVNIEKSMDKILDLSNMENFFKRRTPAFQINFHIQEGNSVQDTLDHFILENEVDLLIMYAPKHDFIDRIFHKSQTRRMAFEN